MEQGGIEQRLASARARLRRVAAEELADAVAAGALVVDIRPIDRRTAEGEMPGAVVIDRNVLEWRLDRTSGHCIADAPGADTQVIIVCNNGYQSSLAAAGLHDQGLAQATDLVGGYRAWRSLADPAPAEPPPPSGSAFPVADRLAALREDYSQQGLRRADLAADPLHQFDAWFDDWAATDPYDSTAVVLATADADGRPSSRYVLLKGISDGGFVFYTNSASRKGAELALNPAAALCFGWITLERQVRVEGMVHPVSGDEADEYWASRPRGSQLGAWASEQSAAIADRAILEGRLADVTERLADCHVPRPPEWGGYRLVPDAVEFWQGRRNRLHDRFRYTRDIDRPSDGWRIDRLSP